MCILCRKAKGPPQIVDPEPGEENGQPNIINPTGIPMSPNMGQVTANPRMTTPNRDQEYDGTSITFNRIGTRWGDVQLANGLRDYIATGRINGYRGEGWYDVVVPVVPGQTRLIGSSSPGYYAPKGGAPSQWVANYQATAGAQPMYPGGP